MCQRSVMRWFSCTSSRWRRRARSCGWPASTMRSSIAEAGQEGTQQRRLSGADVARDADEAARLAQPELQVREGFGVLRREEEVARVRGQPEGRVGEAEEALVHPDLA